MEAAATPVKVSRDLEFEAVQKRCLRLVLFVPAESAILLLSGRGQCQLPRICGRASTKVAAACYSGLRLSGISAIVLKRLSAGIDWTLEQVAETYLLEVLAIRRLPAGLKIFKLHDAANLGAMNDQDRDGIRRAIEHLETPPRESGPCSRPGWLAPAVRWADGVIGAGPTPPANVEQVSALPHSVVVRLVTAQCDCFLKWMPPETHEARAVRVLAGTGVKGLARTLAYDERKGWWLTEAGPGRSLEEQAKSGNAARRCVETLGELQHASQSVRADLAAAGVPQTKNPTRCAIEDVCAHAKTEGFEPEIGSAVRRLGAHGKTIVDYFAAECEGLVHPDADPANMLFDGTTGECMVLDWAFCYLGSAMLSGQYFLYRLDAMAGLAACGLWPRYLQRLAPRVSGRLFEREARALMLFELGGRLLLSYNAERCELARHRLHRRLRSVIADLARVECDVVGGG